MNPASSLTAALIAAEKAHAEFEATLGHRDDQWASWYAQWIVKNAHRFNLAIENRG